MQHMPHLPWRWPIHIIYLYNVAAIELHLCACVGRVPALPVQTLKRKAEERNPDEFYFAMENARTKNGVHDGRCGPCRAVASSS